MTEKEMLITMFEKFGRYVVADEYSLEAGFNNHDCIEFQFDENGNVIDIW